MFFSKLSCECGEFMVQSALDTDVEFRSLTGNFYRFTSNLMLHPFFLKNSREIQEFTRSHQIWLKVVLVLLCVSVIHFARISRCRIYLAASKSQFCLFEPFLRIVLLSKHKFSPLLHRKLLEQR